MAFYSTKNCRVKKNWTIIMCSLSTKRQKLNIPRHSFRGVWRWGTMLGDRMHFCWTKGDSCHPPCLLNVLAADSSVLSGHHLSAVFPSLSSRANSFLSGPHSYQRWHWIWERQPYQEVLETFINLEIAVVPWPGHPRGTVKHLLGEELSRRKAGTFIVYCGVFEG